MFEGVNNIFRYTTPIVNLKSLFKKNQIETSTCRRVSYSKLWNVNNVFLGAILLINFPEDCSTKTRN